MPSEIETETTGTETTITQAEPQEIQNLLSALEKERTGRAQAEKELKARTIKEQELQAQLKRVEAIDPDQYKKLQEAQARRDEDDLLRRKKFDEVRQQYLNEADAARKQTTDLKNQYNSLLTKTAIEKAFFEAGGRKSSFDLSAQGTEDVTPAEAILYVLQHRIRLEETGQIVFLNSVGNTEMNSEGRVKSISEKMVELKKGSMGALFEPENTNSGTGATPTVSSNGKPVKVYSVEQARNGRASMDDIASGKAIITR